MDTLPDGGDAAFDAITRVVTSLRHTHPTRLGIDGRSAAGKTTFADALAEAVRRRGREVVRASIDDFHPAGYKRRSQRGDWTPQTYFDDGYDFHAFRDLLLRPLGPGGTRRCRTALRDTLHDAPAPEQWCEVGEDAVAIIDGAFLLHPELAGCWEYIIWLDIDLETTVERARRRDVTSVGSEEHVVERYRRHWIPTHELYERLTDAPSRAHAVINNRDLQAPTILRLSIP